jgi:hypothetical protein
VFQIDSENSDPRDHSDDDEPRSTRPVADGSNQEECMMERQNQSVIVDDDTSAFDALRKVAAEADLTLAVYRYPRSGNIELFLFDSTSVSTEPLINQCGRDEERVAGQLLARVGRMVGGQR